MQTGMLCERDNLNKLRQKIGGGGGGRPKVKYKKNFSFCTEKENVEKCKWGSGERRKEEEPGLFHQTVMQCYGPSCA